MNFDPKKIEEKIQEQNFEEGSSLFKDATRKFKANKMATLGLFTIIFLFLTSLGAQFTAPFSYDVGEVEEQNLPPTWYKSFMSKEFKEKSIAWAKADLKNNTYDPDEFLDDNTDDEVDEDEYDENDESLLEGETSDTSLQRPKNISIFDETIDHLSSEMTLNYFKMSGSKHLLGTDEIGQDIFSRIIYGMRLSLLLSISVTIVSVLIGIAYGSISGYYGGTIDNVMMRFVDFLFGVPFIFMIILLMVFFGRHVYLIFIGLGLIYWIVLARIVRGQILSIKEKEFVMAAKSNGVSEFKIIFKHLVPNVLGPCIVFSTLLIPQIMLLEAFLSFIGLGVTPPDVSLGILISKGASVLSNYSWPIIYPSIIFSMMIFSMNFIGDGIRDALDPKQQ